MPRRKKKATPAKRKSSVGKEQIINELAQIEDLIVDSDLDIESIMSDDYSDNAKESADTRTDDDSIVSAILSPDESEAFDDGIPVLDDLIMLPDRSPPAFASETIESESVLDDPSMIMRVDPVKPEPPMMLPPPTVVTEQVMEIIESTLQNHLGNELETHVAEELRERVQQALSDWLKPI